MGGRGVFSYGIDIEKNMIPCYHKGVEEPGNKRDSGKSAANERTYGPENKKRAGAFPPGPAGRRRMKKNIRIVIDLSMTVLLRC